MHYLLLILLTSLLLAVGCSDNKVEKHVWQEKTDTIEKAKEVEQLIMDAAKQQRQNMDESSR